MLSFNPVRLSYVIILLIGIGLVNKTNGQKLQGWDTNTDKSLIELRELKQGGPPKDGIPSIDDPKFVSISDASSWISAQEPVISVEYKGVARAYPLQILIWHEIVNDNIIDTKTESVWTVTG